MLVLKVRLDRRVDLRSCRIVYMTVGILLKMLVNGASAADAGGSERDDDAGGDVPPLCLETISHLIIDETHERDVNCDFSLTLLKGMLASPSQPHVPRLVLMSATAAAELFVRYFCLRDARPVFINVPGTTFPVEPRWRADCEKFAGQAMAARSGDGASGRQGDNRGAPIDKTDGDAGGRNNGVALSPRAAEKINNQFIRSLIAKIVEGQQSDKSFCPEVGGPARRTGAILVFLPGMGEIEALAQCLKGVGTSARVLKLHSSVPKQEQQHVFRPAVAGTVKIVLATNIAGEECVVCFLRPLSANLTQTVFC